MEAFFGRQEIKDLFVNRAKQHQALDNFVRDYYWSSDTKKGCAVGCTLVPIELKDCDPYSGSFYQLIGLNDEKGDRIHTWHSLFEAKTGIPQAIAKLEDFLFEHMSIARSKTWPVEFLEAVNVGADLTAVAVWSQELLGNIGEEEREFLGDDDDPNAELYDAETIEEIEEAADQLLRKLQSCQ